jgi:simple sugar transport system substrate-binding protein
MKVKIKSGEFHPFTGPIKAQGGKVIIAAGERASKAKLYKVDYLIDAIVGRLPKKK